MLVEISGFGIRATGYARFVIRDSSLMFNVVQRNILLPKILL